MEGKPVDSVSPGPPCQFLPLSFCLKSWLGFPWRCVVTRKRNQPYLLWFLLLTVFITVPGKLSWARGFISALMLQHVRWHLCCGLSHVYCNVLSLARLLRWIISGMPVAVFYLRYFSCSVLCLACALQCVLAFLLQDVKSSLSVMTCYL